MPDRPSPPELRRPFMDKPPLFLVPKGVAADFAAQLVDDVTQICQRVPYVELAPARLWEPGLVSELADAVDRLAVKVAKLKEAQGEDR